MPDARLYHFGVTPAKAGAARVSNVRVSFGVQTSGDTRQW